MTTKDSLGGNVPFSPPIIGIDFGTNFCRAAVFRNGQVEMLVNEMKTISTPNIVSFSFEDQYCEYGDTALEELALNPRQTVFHAKRMIGRKFTDPLLQSDRKYWPFLIHEDESTGMPIINVDFDKENKNVFPDDICSMILQSVKDSARIPENEAAKVVMAIPNTFTESQRHAMRQACSQNLFDVFFITETNAIALTAFFQMKREDREEERNVLIYDIGAGSLKVSIVTWAGDGEFHVRASGGHSHFGGHDFDNRMVSYFVKEFEKKHRKCITKNMRAMYKLRAACEAAKKVLSSEVHTHFEIEALYDGITFGANVSRDLFEDINHDLFQDILVPVAKALKDAEMDKEEIEYIYLTGGSGRIPKIWELLRDYFDGLEPDITLNTEIAVAHGAALRGATIGGSRPEILKGVVIYDLLPHNLGIELAGGEMGVILQSGIIYPAMDTKTFIAKSNGTGTIAIRIYEGEHSQAKRNNFLAELCLEEKKDQIEIEVTFSVSASLLLTVYVTTEEKNTKKGKEKQVTISTVPRKWEEDRKVLTEVFRLDNNNTNNSTTTSSKNVEKRKKKKKNKKINN